MIKKCIQCGNQFGTSRKEGKFCGSFCASKFQSKSRKVKTYTIKCPCGKEFKCNRANAKYCCIECHQNYKSGSIRGYEKPQKIRGAKWIELGYGKFTLIDKDDYEKYGKRVWRLHRRGYAVRLEGPQSSRKYVYLHRLLIGATSRQSVDHINGDKLDNRKCNLRVATQSQNNANQKMQENTTSEYKGVCFNRNLKANCWRAYIRHNYKMINIGSFSSEEAAARAYDQKAKELFGTFAKLNFPKS